MSAPSVRTASPNGDAQKNANLSRASSLLLVHVEPREARSVCCNYVQDCAIVLPRLRKKVHQLQRKRPHLAVQRQRDRLLSLAMPQRPHGGFGFTMTCCHQAASPRLPTSCQKLDTRAGCSIPTLLQWRDSGQNRQ